MNENRYDEPNTNVTSAYASRTYVDGYELHIGHDGYDYIEQRTREARRLLRNLELRKQRELGR